MGSSSVMLPEWLNANAHRAFPFEDRVYTDTKGVPLPNWMLLDMRAVSLSGYQGGPADDSRYVACELASYSIEREGDLGLSIDMRFMYCNSYGLHVSSGGVMPFGSVKRVVCRSGADSNDLGGGHQIYAVIGTPSILEYDDMYDGEHAFDINNVPLILRSRCIRLPGSVGVDEIRTNSGRTSASSVYVRDGYNTSFRVDGGRLYLTVGSRDGKGFECKKDDDSFLNLSDTGYLESINGQRPDSNGNFVIKAGPGVQITSGEYNGIPAVFIGTTSRVDSFAKP